jgi:hypothetical protein
MISHAVVFRLWISLLEQRAQCDLQTLRVIASGDDDADEGRIREQALVLGEAKGFVPLRQTGNLQQSIVPQIIPSQLRVNLITWRSPKLAGEGLGLQTIFGDLKFHLTDRL